MSPSLLYATAAVLEGCSFVNGGSQNTVQPGLVRPGGALTLPLALTPMLTLTLALALALSLSLTLTLTPALALSLSLTLTLALTLTQVELGAQQGAISPISPPYLPHISPISPLGGARCAAGCRRCTLRAGHRLQGGALTLTLALALALTLTLTLALTKGAAQGTPAAWRSLPAAAPG